MKKQAKVLRVNQPITSTYNGKNYINQTVWVEHTFQTYTKQNELQLTPNAQKNSHHLVEGQEYEFDIDISGRLYAKKDGSDAIFNKIECFGFSKVGEDKPTPPKPNVKVSADNISNSDDSLSF